MTTTKNPDRDRILRLNAMVWSEAAEQAVRAVEYRIRNDISGLGPEASEALADELMEAADQIHEARFVALQEVRRRAAQGVPIDG